MAPLRALSFDIQCQARPNCDLDAKIDEIRLISVSVAFMDQELTLVQQPQPQSQPRSQPQSQPQSQFNISRSPPHKFKQFLFIVHPSLAKVQDAFWQQQPHPLHLKFKNDLVFAFPDEKSMMENFAEFVLEVIHLQHDE